MSKNEVEKQLIFEKFDSLLHELINEAEYSELYGYDLLELNKSDEGKLTRERLIRNFLQANKYEIEDTKGQLVKSLKWRKQFNPLSAAFAEEHKPELQKLGLVTSANRKDKSSDDGLSKIITTWNLYGAVKDRESLFSDLDGFLRWRVGLMEQGVSLLDFSKESESSMTQVHDYFDVSFFRMDSSTKAATKATIDLFQSHYPELLNAKYFVNVPTVMGWVFAFIKPFLSKETTSKFHVLSSGTSLASDIGSWVPKSYGGKAEALEEIKVKEFRPKNVDLVRAEPQENEVEVATNKGEGTATGGGNAATGDEITSAKGSEEPKEEAIKHTASDDLDQGESVGAAKLLPSEVADESLETNGISQSANGESSDIEPVAHLGTKLADANIGEN